VSRGGALADRVEEGGLGPRGDVGGHLEVAEGAAAFGVDHAFRHTLAVEMGHLLDQVVILQQDRATGAGGQGTLIARRGNPGVGGRDGRPLLGRVVVIAHVVPATLSP
jgi:hypothetical protein